MEGWKTSTLGKSCQVVNGATPKTKTQEFWEGSHAWVTPAEMGKRTTPYISATQRTLSDAGLQACSASLLPEQSVIISSRAPIGYLVINTVPMATNQGCKGLIPGSGVKSKFLYYYLYHKVDLLNSLGTGATFKELSATKLKEVPILLPPLPEQERIVAILDEAFAAIATATANAEKNLANARELLESSSIALLSFGGGDRMEISLGELGKVSMCKRILKRQTSPTGDIPFYKIGTFGKAPNAFIGNDIYQSFREKYPFPGKGDILLSASGTIGRRVVYDGEPAYFQDSNIVWIANAENLVINPYLYYFYGTCEWNPSKGATIARLYNDDLRKIKISFPVDRLRQEELVKQLEEVEKNCQKFESIYRSKQAALTNLKQSLLHKAFTGELTADSKAADRSLSEANV